MTDPLPYGLANQPRPPAGPIPSFDEVAFDTALGVFHRTYFHSYKPAVPSDHDECHQAALRDALEAFLGCYIETTGLTR